MELEDLNFMGLSDETKKKFLEAITGVNAYTEKYGDINRICMERNNGENIGTLCTKLIKFSQDLCKSLDKAKEEAVLQSDQEEIEELRKQFLPIIEFSKGMGEAMLDLPEEVVKDDELSDLIGTCLEV